MDRREYLIAASTVGVHGIAGCTGLGGSDSFLVSGTVKSATGTSLAGGEVELLQPGEKSVYDLELDESGYFEQSVSGEKDVELTYFHYTAGTIDGVPVVYGLDTLENVSEETDLGTYEIPEAHQVAIRVTDSNGEPLEDFHIGVASGLTGSGRGIGNVTNADGYVFGDNGLELIGEVTIEIGAPEGLRKTISVPETTEVTFELDNPEQYRPDKVSVSGTVASATDQPLPGGEVELAQFSDENGIRSDRTPIEESGQFEQEVLANANLYLGYYHSNRFDPSLFELDGFPVVYGLGEAEVGSEATDIGGYEVPEGHRVDIRFENAAGDPVKNLDIGIETSVAHANFGLVPTTVPTNDDGYVAPSGNDETGLELAGEVTISVETERLSEQVETISVPETTDVTIELENPEQYGGEV